MQTFMISSDDSQTARALDSRRLNKQLLEVRQILTANAGLSKGWVNHPASKMWRSNAFGLFMYAGAIRDEMQSRGIAWEKNWLAIQDVLTKIEFYQTGPSRWKSDLVVFDRIVTSHRANLYLKGPVHYADFAVDYKVFEANRDYFTCCDRCNYYWPTHLEA